IAKANKEIRDLRARIAELRNYIDDNKRIIFSINRLPAEILSFIFLRTILAPHDRSVDIDAAGSWLISRVCKRWRDIVLCSQQLWSFPIIY
ncbi:hypothetical protein K438DRAFT_1515587, partial [Mycena galopus ATCC 62051]